MSTDIPDSIIQKAAGLVRNARHMVALTGAGVSVPSGIPDFRSQGSGLWTQNDPMEVASLSAFRHRPEKFFAWLHPLAQGMLRAEPNPAHNALAALEKAGILKAVITQNIDNLHQRAGSCKVIEVHGSMDTLTCLRCHRSFHMSDFLEAFIEKKEMPLCPHCRQVLKPDVILFEENLPGVAWDSAQRECRRADLLLVAGSSLEVVPASMLPMHALESGAKLIINTYSSTYLDFKACLKAPYDVAQFLPRLAQAVLAAHGSIS